MRTTWITLALLLSGCSGGESLEPPLAPRDAASDVAADAPFDAPADAPGDARIDAAPDVADAAPNACTALEDQAITDNWNLRVTRTIEAWRLLRARGTAPGQNILIAHPDTGTSFHPELGEHRACAARSPIARELSRDFVDGDRDATHDFDALNRIPQHGHGTETSSVIVSPLGCPDPQEREAGAPTDGGEAGAPRCVTGVAPAARLIPMRVTDAVVLLTGERVARAGDEAGRLGAPVISISHGGVGEMPELATAIRNALAEGVIVIAAAGNATGPIVVQPASFPGVVCVAGITPELKPWGTSARGPRVDISGPATEVPYARTTRERSNLLYETALASGTSDATAMTAGAAALWLSYWGRDALVRRYGKARLPQVFRQILKTQAFFVPPDFPRDGSFGSGVIDMVKLLEASLP